MCKNSPSILVLSFLLSTLCARQPLHVSAARGNTGTLQFLLEYAAAVDAQNEAGDTALHLATWWVSATDG
jgi:hypothetical protein